MEHFKLLIVGAGPSGIAAASKLLENGFNDFKIFEAENRIGGRINSVELDGIPVELGAEWIHGEVDNVVYEMASTYDLAKNEPSFLKFSNTNFFDYSGSHINKDISSALVKAFEEIMASENKELQKEVLDGSVGDYFDKEFEKKLEELRKKINIDEKLSKKFMKVLENWENSYDASDSWYETSMSGHLEYWECDGNQGILWKNRQFKTVFDLLSKTIPDPNKELPINSKIVLNKEVAKIKWNQASIHHMPNVEVECTDGSKYSADYILFTCSLGVLKEKADEMFSPLLPEEKVKCIKNLGFGTVDKIFIKFSKKFWEDECGGFGFLWSDEERKTDTSNWLNGAYCFHPLSPTSHILRGWINGKAAHRMESLSEKEIVDGFNYLFDKFLSSTYQIPKIEKCITSKWYSNPHFRGSYSVRLMKSESSNVWAHQLAKPVTDIEGKPILLFCGEATHDHYFSTVHGAVASGFREAERLLPLVMPQSRKEKTCQVVIVGAGVSGLSAAQTFLESGVTDILILEAQSIPGGRIQSLRFGDYFYELGAQWVHGEKHEVFDICRENNLISDEASNEGEGLFLRANGHRINEKIVAEVDDVVSNILESCQNFNSWKYKHEIPHSIGEELNHKFNQYLDSCNDSEEMKTIKRELLAWHIRFQLIDNSCSDLFDLSAKAWGIFKYSGGNEKINLKNGYSSFVDTILKKLPEGIIHYNTPVERIEWQEEIRHNDSKCLSNFNAKITCNNLIVFSQYVIVTSSLGYLKNNYKKMFSPPLPNYLSQPIECLGFGVIGKIFLIYDQPWWGPNVQGFQLVWPEEKFPQSSTFWGRSVTGFDVTFKGKPFLLAWVSGEEANIKVEKMSEDQIAQDATEILRNFTKNPEIPLPRKVIRSQWWSNEYVRGAYCNVTVQCDEHDISCNTLAQPVYSTIYKGDEITKIPVILLAGEATSETYYSTVHGAFESGQMQAQVVLKHIQNT